MQVWNEISDDGQADEQLICLLGPLACYLCQGYKEECNNPLHQQRNVWRSPPRMYSAEGARQVLIDSGNKWNSRGCGQPGANSADVADDLQHRNCGCHQCAPALPSNPFGGRACGVSDSS